MGRITSAVFRLSGANRKFRTIGWTADGRNRAGNCPFLVDVQFAMLSRDDTLVDTFIGMLNEEERVQYQLSERPDEVIRDEPSIEAIAKDRASGSTLRIEHTRIEPFEGDGADFGRLRGIADALENNPNIAPINRELDVTFEVGAFDSFGKWGRDKGRILNTIVEWFRVNGPSLRNGYTEAEISALEGLRIGVSVESVSGPGSIRVGRRGDLKTFEPTIRRALERKLPKLVKESASRYVLMLEKYVPLHSRYGIAKKLQEIAPEFPALNKVEVWVADTNGWHSAQVVGFYRVWPTIDPRTRWVRGIPEVRLLHKRHLMQV